MYKINPKKLIPNKKDDVTPKILSTLSAIQFNLKSIASITALNKVTNKKQIVQTKKEAQNSEKIEKEVKKETFKPKFRLPKFKMPSMPRLGIFDFIKNFLMMAIFGFLFVNLFNHLPKLKKILNVVISIGDFLSKTIGGLLEGLVSFIDFSYDKFDSFKTATKFVLGENYQKTFDGFTSVLNQYINLLLLGSLAIMSSGALAGGGRGGKGKGEPKGGPQAQVNPKKAPEKITSSANRPKPSSTGPKITGSVVDDIAGQAGKKAAGRGASKLITNGVFVIGPLIDFGIRTLVFKEAVDRAAVGAISTGIGQAIGASLGGVIGGIVGSVVPVVGNLLAGGAGAFVGGLIGGFIGDWIGTSLYEVIKANQGKSPKVQKKEKGGQVTRNGRPVGGNIKRSIKKAKKSPVRTGTRKPNPGKNVGGKKEIVKLFPSPNDPKKRNPLKTLEFAANRFNADPLWGPLMGAAVSASIGEKVDRGVYRNVSRNFGLLVQNMLDGYVDPNFSSFNSNVLAMAEGGIIPPPRTGGLNQTSFGEKFGELMAKSFETMVNNSTNDIFQNIMRQYKLEDFGSQGLTASLDNISGSYGTSSIGSVGNGVDKGVVVAQMLMNDLGISAAAAAGIVGNFLHESAGMNPAEVEGPPYGKPEKPPALGTRNTGYGWAQWTNGRLDAFLKFYGGDKGKVATDQDNYNYLIKEIRSGEPITGIPEDDPEKAASWFRRNWERAGVPADAQRIKYAKEVFSKLKSGSSLMGDKWNAPVSGGMVEGGKKPSTIPLTSGQGWRNGRMHKGVDLDGGHNSPISSAVNATVIQASDIGDGYGKVVILRYSNGSEARFAHLNIIKVTKGQQITVGTVIGTQGDTGASRGSHLHFEYYPRGGAMTYEGYGNAAGAMNSLFRYGGNVRPKVLTSTKDDHDHDHDMKDKNKPKTNSQSLTLSTQSTLKNPRAEQINQRITQSKVGDKFDVVHQGVRYTIKKGESGTEVYGPDGKVSNETFSRAIRNNQPIKPQQISSIPKPLNIPQQIAKWDTAVIPVQERVIATRIVEKRVPVPVVVPSGPTLFPDETSNVNTDKQREILSVG